MAMETNSVAPHLVLTGELDLSNVDQLHEAANLILAGLPRGSVLECDLSRVTFVDSSVLGVLVSIRDQARQRAIELTLRQPSDKVRRILQLTGLDHVFPIMDC